MAFCVGALYVLMPLAQKIGLLDKPNSRKRHGRATPVVGGVAIYIAFLLSWQFVDDFTVSTSLLLWIGLVLVVGVIDDKFDISFRIRLGTHAAIVLGIFLTDGLVVNEIGAILGNDISEFLGNASATFYGPTIAVIFTGIGVVGAVNSTNMMDGLDGLLGSLVLISMIAVFGLSISSENLPVQSFSIHAVVAMIGALAGFLWLNSRVYFDSARVFLGDAGSTTLGLILAYVLIDYTQGSTRIFSPVLAGWILGLPLLDASSVILRRVLDGKSPFAPDRNHLHHRLIDSGVGVNNTVLAMAMIHTILVLVGVLLSFTVPLWSDMILFWGFVMLVFMMTLRSTAAESKIRQFLGAESGE